MGAFFHQRDQPQLPCHVPLLSRDTETVSVQAEKMTHEVSSHYGAVVLKATLLRDELTGNEQLEIRLVLQGLRALLLRILNPSQAALLTLKAHPGGVNVMKLASTISFLDGDIR